MPVKRRTVWRAGAQGSCNIGYGYVLVVAEKPKAARKIAEALSNNKPRVCKFGKVPYWVVSWQGRIYVVASAAGHLFGLITEERGFPVFNYYWAPLWHIDASASYTRPFFETLEALGRKASTFINACDYDIEGSVIGYMIIRHLGGVNRAYRAKFSALTRRDIQHAFRRLSPLDWDMIEAGLARHELDWIWGINVSRALMESLYSVTGKRMVLSAGRVQSPTLIEAVARDREVNLFVPIPSFAVNVSISIGGFTYTGRIAVYDTRREAKLAAEELKKLRFLKVTSYREWKEKVPPPYPFNLSDLQAEAAKYFGYSPMFTQKIAEQLYLDGLISYPRTNSQKIPDTVDVTSIVKELQRITEYRQLTSYVLRAASGLPRPRNGPKDDPAHPAIHPTGEVPTEPLTGARKKIFDLIVRRFLASMAPAATIAHARARLTASNIGSLELAGLYIQEPGWLNIYHFAKPQESRIPRFRVGEKIEIKRVSVRVVYSNPPEPYTKASLVRWMERVGIGTEATRARIVEILFERKYLSLKGRKVEVTELGHAVAEILAKYFPQLTSVELTRYFEEKLESIRNKKSTRLEVVKEAKILLRTILTDYKLTAMRDVGIELAKALNIVKPNKHCIVCQREPLENNLCRFHLEALEKLRAAFNEWHKRDDIDCIEFLRKVSRLKSTGRWIREISEYFAKKGKCPFTSV